MSISKRTVYTIQRNEGCWLEVHASQHEVVIYDFWADGSENGEVKLADNTEDLSDLVAALMDIQMNKTTKENI